jgi:hypothetical protein
MPVQTRSQTAAKKTNKFYECVPVSPVVQKPVVVEKPVVLETPSWRQPNYTFVTAKGLEKLGLTPSSLDPSGKYSIILKASALEYHGKIEKWAVAPDGYYWKFVSKKCYYWMEWWDLCKIPEQEGV